MSQSMLKVGTITVYPDKSVRAVVSKFSGGNGLSAEERKQAKERHERMLDEPWYRELIEKRSAEADYRSYRRTRNMMRDYCMCNDFKWFGTLTFKKQIYNLTEARKVVSKWLDNLRQRYNKEFYYLIVFERHANGGIHCHILLSEHLDDYMEFAMQRRSLKGSRDVYHFKLWKKGFTDFEQIEDKTALSSYIMKYITKDMEREHNKKSYLASKNLKTPLVIKDAVIKKDDFEETYENDYCIVFTKRK